MASSVVSDKANPAAGEASDPFISHSSTGPAHLRYSNFDSQLFALGPGASAEQAKRALEAHLVETERRMDEAGKLGTALVQQRKELAERLKEVEQLQAEGELSSDLRQRLMEIEKDYNDVARESARAFLPKQRVPSNEAAAGSPFAPEGKGGRRSVSPSKFESQGTGSPTKFSVPNRKLRNQPNRIHDIEFAAEISTSLIAQVRNLQALLAEREEELRDIKNDKSRLEIEAEGFQQRLKTLDESEHRYKDENWNLETQIHELIASQKEAADREKKLTQNLNLLQAAKTSTQRELDEVKLTHAKLVEDHVAAIKHHDIELGTAKRNMVMAESERAAMQRKIEDLTGQNQELAKAFSMQRGRALEREAALGMSDEDFETATDNITPEHSPPPSPVKGTPRHSILESETIKTSLHHAQRTIQSLRTNVHREKTEKLELKRMLQEARDELEKMRGDPVAANRRSRKMDSREFKKPGRLGQLGGARSSTSDIYLEDPNWEDHPDSGSPMRSPGPVGTAPIPESSDQFETANETSDAAFETAHERGTETEDFQTGAEEFSDGDAATETESPSKGLGKSKKPAALNLRTAGNRMSFQSTASTSNDEEDYTITSDLKTPTAVTAPNKMRLRVSRGALATRRSRQLSEEPTLQSSPASFVQSTASGTPQQPGQSLFAELGDFEGSDDESYAGGVTPSRRSLRSVTPGSTFRGRTASPPPALPALPRLIMVDNSTMTEPVTVHPVPTVLETVSDRPTSMVSLLAAGTLDASTQWLDADSRGASSRPLSAWSYSDAGAQHDVDMEEKLAQFPSPPSSPPKDGFTPIPILRPPEVLTMSGPQHVEIEPRAEPEVPVSPPSLGLSSMISEHVEPRAEPELPLAIPAALALSSALMEEIQPKPAQEVPVTLSLSGVRAEHIEPRSEPKPTPPPVNLTMSSTTTIGISPRSEPERAAPIAPLLSISSIVSESVEPIARRDPSPVRPHLSLSLMQSVESEPVEPRSPKRDAFIIPRDVDVGTSMDEPSTPTHSLFGSMLGRRKGKAPSTPIIAEDETRQSPSDTPLNETPESQRPFKELSSNSNVRPPRKQAVATADQSAQTTLTSDGIDQILKATARPASAGHGRSNSLTDATGTPSTVRIRRSQDSMNNTARAKIEKRVETPFRRPGSSDRASLLDGELPPLPPNHKEVIEAARTGSASGGVGTIGSMGPPLFPASALRNPAGRPRTPSGAQPISPVSGRGTPTPRAVRTASGQTGTAEVYSPSRISHRSRQSSVSSFASEIDNRFNLHNNMVMDAHGFGPNTDPRMIQAITQTMIGEFLWKYTRKTGRGEMSTTRHRRYFWVHPYTRTLYWSEKDPSRLSRNEVRAKSVSIEAVRVVTDDNPMPPGLHRKSLVVLSPGRSVKFTCTTGQRHETWFNALSYLLLRGDNAGQTEAEEMVGNITREDVDEFNPSFGSSRRATGTRPQPPPSIASYNSRFSSRNASPAVGLSMNMTTPTLTPTPHRNMAQTRPSLGTFSRISGYLKEGKFGSLRSRSISAQERSMYDNSEVHDSAEDLRMMIEKQDREADRLENVRACCDGKHDVGTIPHSSKRGRHSHTPHQTPHSHTHAHTPGPSTTSTPSGTVRTRA